jgi:hypothetical protein
MKSIIRCKSLCLLKIKEIQEFIEIHNQTICPFYDEIRKEKLIDKNKWESAFIESNSSEPNIQKILPLLEKEKRELKKIVKEFKTKVKSLKIDTKLPKVSKRNGIVLTDYTNLTDAKILLSKFTNELNFINECIIELKN